MKNIIKAFLSISFLLMFSCNKQESKYEVKVSLKSNVMPAIAIIYKNKQYLDTLNFLLDGSIAFWDTNIPQNTRYQLKVFKTNLNDTGTVLINWYKSSSNVQTDLLKLDSLGYEKEVDFELK